MMKRQIEENGESEGLSPKLVYRRAQHYGEWQPGGKIRGGGGGRFRGGRDGPWRGSRMPNSRGPRSFLPGNRGRSGHHRYPYDNSQQYNQKSQWRRQYPHDHHHQHSENDNIEMDPSEGGCGCVSGGNCMQGCGNSGCIWADTRNINNKSGNTNVNSAYVANNRAQSGHCAVAGEESSPKTKTKKRSMSQYYYTKTWNKEDAEKALAVESAQMKNENLVIHFPDVELNKDMVMKFHPGIENVYFQVRSGPRYCFVQLAANVNPDSVIKDLSQITFGSGKLFVERKFSKEEEDLTPEAIDPYTLYIGNLPTNVKIAAVKEKFPTAARVDVGFAQRMKFTRYAFIRYTSVDDAIEAYKLTHNLVLGSRSIVVRFRRKRGPGDLPNGTRQQKRQTAKKDIMEPKKEKEKNEYPKESIEENGESEDSSPNMCGSMQHYGRWQQKGQGNMSDGERDGFRGGRGGPWQGPWMLNSQGPCSLFRGNRRQGGPPRYPYDNLPQYNQKSQWHQQYPHDHHHQHSENDNIEMAPTESGSGCNISNKSGNTNVNSTNDANNRTQSGHDAVVENYSSRPYYQENAEKPLAVESAHMKGLKNESLVIQFPDPELNKDMVKNFHPGIENVYFQVHSGPRYCFVQLAANVDVDAVMKDLSQMKFGSGKLLVEKKFSKEEDEPTPELEVHTHDIQKQFI